MLFSVIIPVYNVEHYISQCIESVLTQTFSDFELVLVDDGSLDNSPSICDHFAHLDSRVRVIHTTNAGASAARNRGIKASTGEYLCFLDADDYWDKNTVLYDISQTIKNKEPDIIRIGIKTIRDSNSQLISDPAFDYTKFQVLKNEDVLHELVADGVLKISACSVAIHRSFLQNNNLYFKEGIRVEDLEWAIRCYAQKPLWGFISDNVYVSRRGRTGSVTNTVGKSHLSDYLKVIKDSISLVVGLEDKYQYPLLSYLMYQTSILIGLLPNCAELDRRDRKEFDKQLKIICNRYYNKYTLVHKVKCSLIIYNIIGYSGLKYFLGLYIKLRGR